jgi:hypothetical protein
MPRAFELLAKRLSHSKAFGLTLNSAFATQPTKPALSRISEDRYNFSEKNRKDGSRHSGELSE